jgi:hypothetical protein
MRHYYKFLIGLIFIGIGVQKVSAQVDFKLDLMGDNQTYKFSIISGKTWEPPMNTAATFQATIKVPVNAGFELGDIESLVDGLFFTKSGFIKSPAESPDYEYFTFSFIRPLTDKLEFEEGKEMPLFTFKNKGICPGPIELIDNVEDPFIYPNSENVVIGNYLSVAGAGGNAFKSLSKDNKVADCSGTTIEEQEKHASYFEILKVFPNPTVDQINLVFWISDKATASNFSFEITDNLGKVKQVKNVESRLGKANVTFDVHDFPAGSYFVNMKEENGIIRTRKFIKLKE